MYTQRLEVYYNNCIINLSNKVFIKLYYIVFNHYIISYSIIILYQFTKLSYTNIIDNFLMTHVKS
jgi:hypothetical protein